MSLCYIQHTNTKVIIQYIHAFTCLVLVHIHSFDCVFSTTFTYWFVSSMIRLRRSSSRNCSRKSFG